MYFDAALLDVSDCWEMLDKSFRCMLCACDFELHNFSLRDVSTLEFFFIKTVFKHLSWFTCLIENQIKEKRTYLVNMKHFQLVKVSLFIYLSLTKLSSMEFKEID